MSRRDREQSVRIALGGMLGAGSLVILWLACIVPSGWLGLTAVAGLFPVTATLYAGRAAGYMCWAAGSLLGLVLLPNKGIPLLYLVFLGLYPVVKSRIEGLRRGAVEWLLKLILFNAALILCWRRESQSFLLGETWYLSVTTSAYPGSSVCWDIV